MTSSSAKPRLPDYYTDLGISQQASYRDIRLSYLKLARKHHPDKTAPGQSIDAKDFRKIQEAYEYLFDKDKRPAYDARYFDLRQQWDQYRESQEYQHRDEERKRAEEQQRAARERAEMEKRAAEAERIRRMKEEEQAAKEKAERERLRQEKIRQAEIRSQEAALRAREQQEQAARERIRKQKAEEAERRSQEAARKARMEQEQAAQDRLKNILIEERQDAVRRNWAKMREATEHPAAESAKPKPSQTLACPHPQFGWQKKNSTMARICTFCGESRRRWSYHCPMCNVPACPKCKAKYCVF
ncbi:DnaJ-domain-containing protein [Hypoxylon cercidicola]|nr:DnaJ-domain-containing protein [Hypoxylon cercidicola]